VITIAAMVALFAGLLVMVKRGGEEARRHQAEELARHAREEFQRAKAGSQTASLWNAELIGMLAADADCIRNIRTLNCGDYELTGPAVSELKKLVNVRYITFYCSNSDNILAAAKGMPSIEELSFDSTSPSEQSIRSFVHLPNLKKLHFTFLDGERERLLRKILPEATIEIDEREPDGKLMKSTNK
jgi:hypothetical protein